MIFIVTDVSIQRDLSALSSLIGHVPKVSITRLKFFTGALRNTYTLTSCGSSITCRCETTIHVRFLNLIRTKNKIWQLLANGVRYKESDSNSEGQSFGSLSSSVPRIFERGARKFEIMKTKRKIFALRISSFSGLKLREDRKKKVFTQN